MNSESKHTPPKCPQCGALLSCVTWKCVRGPYCHKPKRPEKAAIPRAEGKAS